MFQALAREGEALERPLSPPGSFYCMPPVFGGFPGSLAGWHSPFPCGLHQELGVFSSAHGWTAERGALGGSGLSAALTSSLLCAKGCF